MSFAMMHAKGTQKRAMRRPEQDLQRSIIDFCRYAMTYMDRPITDWLFHVPNGGKRSATEAAIMKGLGVKAGVNDLVLPIAMSGYGGLWIELKDGKTPLTDAQLDFHQRLRQGGQKVTTCRTLDETVHQICDYMRPSGAFVLRGSLG